MWDLLKDMIWNEELVISVDREGAAFAEHGPGLGISTIYLLSLYCSLMNAWAQPPTHCTHLNIPASTCIALRVNRSLC
jgi:hypothetical protein